MRLVELELTHVRNVEHGVVTFDDLESGGSLTGLYGQNGSGKTTVIDVIGALDLLMSGEPLPASYADLIDVATGTATIRALIRINDNSYIEYAVDLRRDDTKDATVHVTDETLRMGGDRRRMGRVLLSHTTGPKGHARTPEYLWRGLRTIPGVNDDLLRTEDRAYLNRTSFVFSPKAAYDDSHELVLSWLSDEAANTGMSAKANAYAKQRLKPLAEAIERLHAWACHDVLIATTGRGATAAYRYVPLSLETGREIMFDLIGRNLCRAPVAEAVRKTVRMLDDVMQALIPGLRVELRETPAESAEDGTPQVRLEMFSIRGERTIPFRCESEGVIRLAGLVSFLVRAFNEPDALVAIDEIDAGVFELLLGDMMSQMRDGMEGQLVFTAHDLRAVELLPAKCIRLTTTDPDDRFMTFPRLTGTDNPRRHLLGAGIAGWEFKGVYDAPLPYAFSGALYEAGHPDTGDGADDPVGASLEALANIG